MNSYQRIYNGFFSHIYVENDAFNYPLTEKIISRLTSSEIIKINHYKDIFCRTNQNFEIQKKSPSLILAVKHGNLIYKGADMCQSFGNDNFYYTSTMMNCIYNCEYCYLKGMYPSANIVVFVNIEDIFEETERLLKKSSVYLCVSYDTDIAAMEKISGNVSQWLDFARGKENFKAEIRTKSTAYFDNIPDNVIFAFTLSPDYISSSFEHNCPSLKSRIENIKRFNAPVRLCFDPLIYTKDFEKIYGEFFDYVFSEINSDNIRDISIGTFRISSEYIKILRKQSLSAVINYPFISENGTSGYGKKKAKYMTDFALGKILNNNYPREKIFIWEDN